MEEVKRKKDMRTERKALFARKRVELEQRRKRQWAANKESSEEEVDDEAEGIQPIYRLDSIAREEGEGLRWESTPRSDQRWSALRRKMG